MNIPYRVVSTFSGCGGSSLGYHQAGMHVIYAVDNDPHSVQCYRLNFADTPIWCGDIVHVTAQRIYEQTGIVAGELYLLDGSPPCQGFSTAGKRRVYDPRNRLFEEFVRLLNELRPKVFVMENVSGMVRSRMRHIFAQALTALRDVGYKVAVRILDASWFGVPQQRRRLIFVGIREDLHIMPSHPRGNAHQTTIRDVLPTVDGVCSPCGYNGNERTNWRHYNEPAPTICSARVHTRIWQRGQMRHVTIDECKLLMGFPTTFQLIGADTQQWARLGNAVPPPLIRAVAEHIKTLVPI